MRVLRLQEPDQHYVVVELLHRAPDRADCWPLSVARCAARRTLGGTSV